MLFVDICRKYSMQSLYLENKGKQHLDYHIQFLSRRYPIISLDPV